MPKRPAKPTDSLHASRLPVKSRLKRSSPDATRELIRRYRAGDLAARNQVWEENLPLVVSIAKKYALNSEELQDYVQVGSLQLLRVIQRFDPDLGFNLSTYATHSLRQILHRYRNARHLISMPDNAWSNESTREAALKAQMVLSIHEPIRLESDGDAILLSQVMASEPDDHDALMDQRQVVDRVQAAIKMLPPRERDVVERRTNGEKLQEIGNRLGVSKERVRQIETKAHAILREHLRDLAA